MALFHKLFGGRQEVVLRTYDADDHSILFTCQKALSAGEHDLQAVVGDHKMRCKIRVDSLEAGMYYGEFLEPKDARAHLAVLLPKPLSRQEKRSAKRVKRGLRVTSQRIPRYVAITSDFSASGLALIAEGPMVPEEDFEARIEFDDETLSQLDVTCRVKRCRPEGEKFLVGAEFRELSKPAAARIAYFVQDLSKVEPGVVSNIYQFD